jgi:hypothetical protein
MNTQVRILFILAATLGVNTVCADGFILPKTHTITIPALKFRDEPLGDVLKAITTKATEADPDKTELGLVIVLPDRLLRQKLTLSLRNVTLHQALDAIKKIVPIYVIYQADRIIIRESSGWSRQR